MRSEESPSDDEHDEPEEEWVVDVGGVLWEIQKAEARWRTLESRSEAKKEDEKSEKVCES